MKTYAVVLSRDIDREESGKRKREIEKKDGVIKGVIKKIRMIISNRSEANKSKILI